MAKPRFEQFQKVDQFMIADYLRWTNINPRNGHAMVDGQHWYKVRCACGNVELRSQQELRDIRYVRACANCRSELARNNKR